MSTPDTQRESVELVERFDTFTRALMGRLSSGASCEAQAHLLRAGVQQTRELVELRDRGYNVSEATIELAFVALLDACDRLVELMPAGENGWRR